jgi:oligoendopeptidase F
MLELEVYFPLILGGKMTQIKLRLRNQIPEEYKWNSASIFVNDKAWNEACDQIPGWIQKIAEFKGHLAEDPSILKAAIRVFEEAYILMGKVYEYAALSHEVDTTNQNATLMQGKAMALYGQFVSAASYLDPELVEIGQPVLREWFEKVQNLQPFWHYIDNLFRKQAHVRSSEVEQILGMLGPAFISTETTASVLTDADFQFPPAHNEKGEEIVLTQGTLQDILGLPDRKARQTAWENYMDKYLEHKNALANNLYTAHQQSVFSARVRNYQSTLEASLFENAVPTEVFHNLINTFKRFLPVWHRYWKIRRKALGVDKLHTYDIWAPLTNHRPLIPFKQAIDLISEGLAPMGEEYVGILRRGCLVERWIDVYPSPGKSSKTFSSGFLGTYPFIVMSYDDTIFSLSTTAHELGHSMHSYYTWKTQPFYYSDYSLFLAEVASNFHQAMVRAHLLATNNDPDFQISVIEEAMNNFHRYFFIMPTLARFELEMHQRVERGEGLNAEGMMSFMADLYAEGYGDDVALDQERDGITWATFNHLYNDYYVYAYATGISGAHALSGLQNGTLVFSSPAVLRIPWMC